MERKEKRKYKRHNLNTPGWRSFILRIIAAGDGDPNVSVMFFDNVRRTGAENTEHIDQFIHNGDFKSALMLAFPWYDTPEKLLFWSEVHEHLRNPA